MPAIWHSAKTVSLAVNRAPPHSSLSLSQSHHSHPPLVARTSPRRAHATRSLPRRPSPLFAGRPAPPHHTQAAPPLPTILRLPRSPPIPVVLMPPRSPPSPPSSRCHGRRPSPPSSRRPAAPRQRSHLFIYLYVCM
jgi:hypothetical protein